VAARLDCPSDYNRCFERCIVTFELPSPTTRDPRLPDHRQAVRKVLVITLVLNLLVVGLKSLVGFWTGSLSLLADALHSVTDSANNVLGLVTNQLASRTPIAIIPTATKSMKRSGPWALPLF
jgi:hypothetical protein